MSETIEVLVQKVVTAAAMNGRAWMTHSEFRDETSFRLGLARAAIETAYDAQAARIAELTERIAELEAAAIKFLKAHVPSGEEPDFIVDPEDVYNFDVALGLPFKRTQPKQEATDGEATGDKSR